MYYVPCAMSYVLGRPLFQVWNQGVFFIGFSMIFCDLGAIWGFLLVPFGFLSCCFYVVFVVSGTFWNAFW